MEDKGSMDIRVELKKTVICQHKIPGQHLVAVKPLSKITE